MRRTVSMLVLSLGLVGLAPLSAQAQSFEREPYLQMGGPDSMVVSWRTTEPTEGVVRFGTSPDDLSQVVASTGKVTDHHVAISGLTPSTRYYYSVGTPELELARGLDYYFETSPPTGTRGKFRFWVVGDSGKANTVQQMVRDSMLNWVGEDRPDFYLHVGDMTYSDGTHEGLTTEFFEMYPTVLRNTVFRPAPGNHDLLGKEDDGPQQDWPYYESFVLPTGGELGGVPSGTEAWYSYDYANVHFVVLDPHGSHRESDGPMLSWLAEDLAATRQDWIIVYFHHAPYTKGSHDSDDTDRDYRLVEMRENAVPIMEAAGVDLVLTGHSHIYERSFLIDGAYDTPTTAEGHILDAGDGKALGDGAYRKRAGLHPRNGSVHVVAGHGGAGISGSADHPLMCFSEKEWGSLVIDVQGNRLHATNIRHDGEVSDSFDLVKGDAIILATLNGGELLAPGAKPILRWQTVGNVRAVHIEASANDGLSWVRLASDVPNTGSWEWTVPDVATTRGLLRVVSATAPELGDESNAGFTITGKGELVAPR